jgi:hypothetical protein
MESIVGNSNSTREGLKSTFEGMMKSYGNWVHWLVKACCRQCETKCVP